MDIEQRHDLRNRAARVKRLADSMPRGIGREVISTSLQSAAPDGHVMWDAVNLAACHIHNKVQEATALIKWALDNQEEYINCDPDEAEQGQKDIDRLLATISSAAADQEEMGRR